MSSKHEVHEALVNAEHALTDFIDWSHVPPRALAEVYEHLAKAKTALLDIAETGRTTGPWLRKDVRYPLKYDRTDERKGS